MHISTFLYTTLRQCWRSF